jgi:branched-chain amino acid transport system substrate-binding protein
LRRRVLGTLLLVLLAIQAPVAAQQPEPYVIDAIIGLTGVDAFTGNSLWAPGLRAFEKWANANGGINGRPLHFEIRDDQSNPQIAVQLATDIIAHHPAVMIGGGTTASCAAIGALTANGPVSYCLSPGYLPAKGSYNFASSASLSVLVLTELRFARLKGYHRLAIINATDATGQATDQALQNDLTLAENHDVTYVAVEHFNAADLSVAAQVARIKAANPDAIVCFATGTGFTTVLRALHDAGLALPIVTTPSNLDAAHLSALKTFAPPLYAPTSAVIYYQGSKLPAGPLRNALSAYAGGYKAAGETIVGGSPFAWDPPWIVVAALRKLGPNATAQQLRDYLLSLHDFVGVNGTYDFRIGDQHGLTDASVAIVRWDDKTNSVTVASKPGGYPL